MLELSKLLTLDQESLSQIFNYVNTLPDAEASDHLRELLDDSPEALEFIGKFVMYRREPAFADFKKSGQAVGEKARKDEPNLSSKTTDKPQIKVDSGSNGDHKFDPPPYPPPKSQSQSQPQSKPAAQVQYHTNVVIEAGRVRARDEVCQTALEPSRLG